jgi:1-acyl-sn-glycerol-3-phosphate acyltransferase
MRRTARTLWRLARASLHVLHGVAIVLLRFDAMSAVERHACIRWFAGKLLRLMGIALRVVGEPPPSGTLLVANHVSWLDIMAIHAVLPQARFVSKADVRSWPLLSRLIDGGGTLYLERERKRDALRVVQLIGEALAGGETVAVFPEGTTADGRTLLPFHANLLQAAVAIAAPVQPVALRYSDAREPISRAAEFVGATTLVESLWRVARAESLTVRVALLAPLPSAGIERRALAELLRARIDAALVSLQPLPCCATAAAAAATAAASPR